MKQYELKEKHYQKMEIFVSFLSSNYSKSMNKKKSGEILGM